MRIVDRPVGEDDLQAYVDGRLDPERLPIVEAYLAEQEQVAIRVAGYIRDRDALRAALQERYDAPVPAHFRVDAIAQRLKATRRHYRPAVAAAAAWLLVGGAAGWLSHKAVTPAVPVSQVAAAPPMEDALMAHRVYVADVKHPVEVGADQQAHLQMWLSKRVGRKLVAPDLSAGGYRLLGGRLVSAATGPAALFMYQNAQGERITVYVRRSARRDAEALAFTEEDGVGAAYWYQGGYGFAVSANTERAAVFKLAASAQRQLAS